MSQVKVKEPADGQWGRQMENGSWTGVVTTLGFLIFVLAFGIVLIVVVCVAIVVVSYISLHQIKMLYVGGNGGEQTGRLVDEPGLDRREGEGHRLLCSLHRFVSSTLSLCLKKFRDNSLANKKQSFVIILIQLIS